MIARRSLVAAALASTSALALGIPASAQTVPTAKVVVAPAAQEAEVEAIIVTGSRITRPGVVSATPVTSLSGEDIRLTGIVSLGDILSDLPSLRSTFTNANSGRFIGTAGLNIQDLRGLGVDRTLTLVNGRRHVSSLDGTFNVDTNTIPIDLIERVDVITGGASAIYGSDAVAGVLNFVLKDKYSGLNVKAQTGGSSRGDNQSSFASITGGTNFASGRGNIAGSFEWAREEAFSVFQRPTTATRQGFILTELDPAGRNSDGIPDNSFITDIHAVNLTEGGTFIPSFQPGAATVPASLRLRTANNQPRVFRFQPDGSLIEGNYGQRDFRPLASSTFGGDGSTLRRYGYLTPSVQRYATNLVGHYDFTPQITGFFEAKWVRTESFNLSSPSFNQTVSASTPGPFGSGALRISLTNPYLTPQALTLVRSLLPTTATAFNLNRNNLDLGIRGEDTERNTLRFVAGFRGNITDELKYELSYNYGQTSTHTDVIGNRLERNLRLSVDAARANDGTIVCRSRLVGGVVTVTGDPVIDSCVPVNVLGDGNVSQAARNYINSPSTFNALLSQQVVNGFIGYDTGKWLKLPGGPIDIVVGGEYRRETSRSGYSDDVTNGLTFLNQIQPLDAPRYEVAEGFGEINVPLAKDYFLVKELSINGAVRAASYNLRNTSTVYAWNAGAVYAPVKDIKFRFGYSRSVRAPNFSDLYSPLTQNFANVQDPCDVNFINQGTTTRAANCAAAGVPAGFINTVARSQTIEIRSGGNPGLNVEKSRSITAGAVIQPRYIPGLSLTIDYYDIEISSVIASASAQQILNNCYDFTSLNNAFCALIFRDPATNLFYANGNGPIGGGVLQSSLNFAKRTARGIDAELNYRFNWESVGKISTRWLGTYVINRDNFPFVNEPNRPDQILEELGDPVFTFNFDLGVKRGPWSFDYSLRFIGSQYVNTIEDIRSVGGRPVENPDFTAPNLQFTGPVLYHGIRVNYDLNSSWSLYAGVNNIADQLPPLGFTGTGGGSGIYQNTGRYFYGGFRWKL